MTHRYYRQSFTQDDLDTVVHLSGDRRKSLKHLTTDDFRAIVARSRGTATATGALVAMDEMEKYGAHRFGDLFGDES